MAGRRDVGQARAHGLREVVVAVVHRHELLEEGLKSQQGDLLDIAEPAEHLRRQDDVGIGEAGVDDDPSIAASASNAATSCWLRSRLPA